jgi:predicted DNA-binding protein with PD1-like motif
MAYELMEGRIDRVLALVVESGGDLKSSIEEAAKSEGITSGAILSGIGTLERAVLRNPKTGSIPPEVSMIRVEGPVELLSLEGNISIGPPEGSGAEGAESINAHLHAMVSDRDGRVFGGSLAPGSIVWRQVELLIAKIGGIALKRELDPKTKLTRLTIKKS